MQVLARVRRTIRHHQLATVRTRVMAAVSGGSDSVALARILRTLADEGDLQFVALAHLNHQLRDTAAHDETFCRALAAELHVAFVSESIDVRSYASDHRCSIEDAGHRVRHAFFGRSAAALACDVIALGHTADDQAETVLLRLLRGAGTKGLAGMYPRRDTIVRPLLDCRRAELRAYLDEQGCSYLHDETNDDPAIPRNRIRAELLPLLERRFNPKVVEVLARTSSLARDEQTYLQALATEWASTHAQLTDGSWRVNRAAITSLPVPLARRVIHTALVRLSGQRPVGFTDVQRALDVAAGTLPGYDAPGQRVQRIGDDIVLTGGAAGRDRLLPPRVSQFCYPLPVPGETTLSELGVTVSAELRVSGARLDGDPDRVAVPLQLVHAGLVVRNRRPGDRLKPSGAGHRKLQDVLVDRKVPRAQRDRVPIVADARGRIVWVAGHVLDRDFRVTDPAQAVVVLTLKVVGGSV